MAEYRHLAIPDKEWVDFPHHLPLGTRIEGMSRDRLPTTPQEGLEMEEFDISSSSDNYLVRVRTYRKTRSEDLPLFIYMHAGGFVTGGLETDDRYCRRIAADLGILMLSVEYRLAPENKFPVGFQDAFDVVRWIGHSSICYKNLSSFSGSLLCRLTGRFTFVL
ncbi:uncharacterized protein Z518_07470 [Rhinocladiella mackenziei CBS 650.93]|uniref:Alpha/beta hydrolase fold-3 domain-containing protein n=1 Tax=Rhinocladiella mackenziei CBS 650.93 TaxID=1442369 RepID=A0A0D2FP66_9EURO|nr:uncharacterized protein Z518_07470 [Rhinocladiella mackenziei CBS 650.93]KIX03917.1 hypothetical protein Z518_07470 [Rhinocladiella mackenziei CBS 650.93]